MMCHFKGNSLADRIFSVERRFFVIKGGIGIFAVGMQVIVDFSLLLTVRLI